MTLFLSDLHLGRGTEAETLAAERDAVALLRAHEALVVPAADGATADGDRESALVLLGDVFDQWIEYRHTAPKLGVRLVGLLADWADRGARVVYTVGNRDPWHAGHLRALGVQVESRGVRLRVSGYDAYLSHGDRDLPARHTAGRLAHRLLPLLRHPAVARLYRSVLPGDAGYALARAVGRRFGSGGAPEADDSAVLARAAHARLTAPGAPTLVAHGHVHETALSRPVPGGGLYLNPGYWFGDRTFARLDTDGPALARWTDGHAVPL